MITEFLILGILAVLIYQFYRLGTKNENFFVERGLKFKKPVFLIGNYLPIFLRKTSLFEYARDINKDFPNEKIIGHFDFRRPVAVLLDPELAKQVSVKDFENFANHAEIFSEAFDPDFGNSLIALKDQKWKDMRSTLSPAFTGSKMRLMCDFIVETCEQMVDFLKLESEIKGPQTFDAKELLSRVTLDVIGTCAFGVKVNSFKDTNNAFFVTAKKLVNFRSAILQFKFLFLMMCPKVMEFLNIKLFDTTSKKFLKDIVLNAMKVREEKKIIRPDMVHLLMEAKKGTLARTNVEKDSAGFATVEESPIESTTSPKTNWTDTELIAQCFVFFVAGYEGVSNAANFMLYEVMVNPDIQEKLYEEISGFHNNLEGKSLNYEYMKKLKYVDMFTAEFLRKFTQPFLDRVCTRDCTLKYDGDKEYTFKKGDLLWIPTGYYHHNPEFFPDPEKTNPERFSDENKHLIKPFTYAPFGLGPRNCIASRFALMELKTILYYVVLNFHLEPTKETQIPLKFAKGFIGPVTEKKVYIKFRPREDK
uniref:Putative cytochrome n=1 Tax=Nyssomyia neivai TaxID=330878 RepID=A0A1L8E430_9DIPT